MTKLHDTVLDTNFDEFLLALNDAKKAKKLNGLHSGYTALHFAARAGNFAAAFHLIEMGASTNASKAHKKAFDFATDNKHDAIALLLAMHKTNIIEPHVLRRLTLMEGFSDYLIAILYSAISLSAKINLRAAVKFIKKYAQEFIEDYQASLQGLLILAKNSGCDEILKPLNSENDLLLNLFNQDQLNDFQKNIYQAATEGKTQALEEFCSNSPSDLANVLIYAYQKNDFVSIKTLLSIETDFYPIHRALLLQKNPPVAKLLLIKSFGFYHHSNKISHLDASTIEHALMTAIKTYLIDDNKSIAQVQKLNKNWYQLSRPLSFNTFRISKANKEAAIARVNKCINSIETELAAKKWWHYPALRYLAIDLIAVAIFILLGYQLIQNRKNASEIKEDPNYDSCGSPLFWSSDGSCYSLRDQCADLCNEVSDIYTKNVFELIGALIDGMVGLVYLIGFFEEFNKARQETPSERFAKLKTTWLTSKNQKEIAAIYKLYKTPASLPLYHSTEDCLQIMLKEKLLTYLEYELNRVKIKAPAHFFSKKRITISIEENATRDATNQDEKSFNLENDLDMPLLSNRGMGMGSSNPN